MIAEVHSNNHFIDCLKVINLARTYIYFIGQCSTCGMTLFCIAANALQVLTFLLQNTVLLFFLLSLPAHGANAVYCVQ